MVIFFVSTMIIIRIICYPACVLLIVFDLPWGIKFMSFVIAILPFLITSFWFAYYSSRYPKNDPNEFLYDFKRNGFKKYMLAEKTYLIDIEETKKGEWIINTEDKKIRLNVQGFVFPKYYISTYFIRNIHYITFNKNRQRWRFYRLFKRMRLDGNKYQNVTLRFIGLRQTKNIQIIKDGRSRVNLIQHVILTSKYFIRFIGNHRHDSYFARLDKNMDDSMYIERHIPSK